MRRLFFTTSPSRARTNGRGLMNYGLTQMEKGDTQKALDYFIRAAAFTPNYPTLEIKLE